MVKGILCVDDARRAVELGADGIVLSNHGGRQLDGAMAGVELLPAVAAELRDRATLIVDGGFRRGSDMLKAMALGAHAVMIGRATLYGLAAGGEAGVAHALALLRAEMERAMTLLGCRNMAEVGRHLIRAIGATSHRVAAPGRRELSGVALRRPGPQPGRRHRRRRDSSPGRQGRPSFSSI